MCSSDLGMARYPSLPDKRGTAKWDFGFKVPAHAFPFFIVVVVVFGFLFFIIIFFLLIRDFLCVSGNFADRHAAKSNFNLVNKESLDKMLQAEVFVHDDSQL